MFGTGVDLDPTQEGYKLKRSLKTSQDFLTSYPATSIPTPYGRLPYITVVVCISDVTDQGSQRNRDYLECD